MSAPQLAIKVEPSEAGAVAYLPLAPKTISSPPNGQLSLLFKIQNNESQSVKVNQLTVSFPGQTSVNPFLIPLSLVIPASVEAPFPFEKENNIILPVPAPQQITISLSCDGYTEPATVTMPLRPYVSPVNDGAYYFPARAQDLREGEFWQGVSARHDSGSGYQLFAYDMIVVAFDAENQRWPGNLPGTNGTQNEHARTWGKPVYAMADGVVLSFRNDIPNNPTTVTGPVEGSSFFIKHGSEVALYAHLNPDSMNPDLLQIGAPVSRGTFLGRAGNSGHSSGPHLHIHVVKHEGPEPWRGPLRPIPFKRVKVIERPPLELSDDAGWVYMTGQGLPSAESLIVPDAVTPTRPDLGDLKEQISLIRVRLWVILALLALGAAGILLVVRFLR